MIVELDKENADRDLTSQITILTHTPDANNPMLCQGLIFLGDGAKDLDGTGGDFELTIMVGGRTIQPDPQIIEYSTAIESGNWSTQFIVPENEEVIMKLKSPNGADTDVDVTVYLYDISAQGALVLNNLDHMAKVATAAADMTAEVVDDSILSRILSNGDTSVFDPSTDGLQPIRDRGDASWPTAAGFATPGDAMTLTGAYDAAKTAAQAGNEMDFVNAPNGTAITAIQSGLGTEAKQDTIISDIAAVPDAAAIEAAALTALNTYDPPTHAEMTAEHAALSAGAESGPRLELIWDENDNLTAVGWLITAGALEALTDPPDTCQVDLYNKTGGLIHSFAIGDFAIDALGFCRATWGGAKDDSNLARGEYYKAKLTITNNGTPSIRWVVPKIK